MSEFCNRAAVYQKHFDRQSSAKLGSFAQLRVD